jgi:hypothetical protein
VSIVNEAPELLNGYAYSRHYRAAINPLALICLINVIALCVIIDHGTQYVNRHSTIHPPAQLLPNFFSVSALYVFGNCLKEIFYISKH